MFYTTTNSADGWVLHDYMCSPSICSGATVEVKDDAGVSSCVACDVGAATCTTYNYLPYEIKVATWYVFFSTILVKISIATDFYFYHSQSIKLLLL